MRTRIGKRGGAWRLVGLCAAAASAGLALGALELLAPSILHEYRLPGITLTAAQAGAADLASFALGSLLSSLLAGTLQSQTRWLPAGLALLALLATGIAISFGHVLVFVWLARLLLGGLAGLLLTATLSSTAASAKFNRSTRAPGIVAVIWISAAFAGPLLGLGIDHLVGTPLTIVLVAVLPSLAFAGVGLPRAPSSEECAPAKLPTSGPDLQSAGPFGLLAVAGGGIGMALAGLAAEGRLHGQAAATLLVMGFAAAAAMVTAPLQIGRAAPKRWIIAGFLTAAMGFLLLQGALSQVVVAVAAVLLGAGLGMVAPSLLGVAARGPADWPWRRAVAALSLGQLSAALVAALLWATPLLAGSPYVLLATMLAMAGFASGGLVPDTTLPTKPR